MRYMGACSKLYQGCKFVFYSECLSLASGALSYHVFEKNVYLEYSIRMNK